MNFLTRLWRKIFPPKPVVFRPQRQPEGMRPLDLPSIRHVSYPWWHENSEKLSLEERKTLQAAMFTAWEKLKKCPCRLCRSTRGEHFEYTMLVCELCGDKRCPHVDDHRRPCLKPLAAQQEP
jgi:hypothetical protein